jgi:hypothetical protein
MAQSRQVGIAVSKFILWVASLLFLLYSIDAAIYEEVMLTIATRTESMCKRSPCVESEFWPIIIRLDMPKVDEREDSVQNC